MRPIHHPRIEDVVLSDLLHALADPIRIKIFQALNEVPEISCGGAATHHGAPQSSIPKATLSRHFNLMREAGLVQSVRDGITTRNSIRRAELDSRFPGLLDTLLGLAEKEARREHKRSSAKSTKKALPLKPTSRK